MQEEHHAEQRQAPRVAQADTPTRRPNRGVAIRFSARSPEAPRIRAALVAVHGLIDQLYLKELAKKVKRGLAGQMDRGFSTGGRQYGFRKILVPDPSGKKDAHGQSATLGTRIEVDPDEAKVIQMIFEWAAEGVGLTSIVERLNAKGIPGTGGKRWTKTPVRRVLQNERYLGRQIWGQQFVDHEPGTGRRIMRDNPRSEWRVEERPELRIVSDELWNRVQQTRSEVRKSVAPKQNLARGKDGKGRSIPLETPVHWLCEVPRVWRRDDECQRWHG